MFLSYQPHVYERHRKNPQSPPSHASSSEYFLSSAVPDSGQFLSPQTQRSNSYRQNDDESSISSHSGPASSSAETMTHKSNPSSSGFFGRIRFGKSKKHDPLPVQSPLPADTPATPSTPSVFHTPANTEPWAEGSTSAFSSHPWPPKSGSSTPTSPLAEKQKQTSFPSTLGQSVRNTPGDLLNILPRQASHTSRIRRMSHDGVLNSAANSTRAILGRRSSMKSSQRRPSTSQGPSPSDWSKDLASHAEESVTPVYPNEGSRPSTALNQDLVENDYKEELQNDLNKAFDVGNFNVEPGNALADFGISLPTSDMSSAFEESVVEPRDLSGYPLPVRLGLISPEIVEYDSKGVIQAGSPNSRLERLKSADEAFPTTSSASQYRAIYGDLVYPQFRDGYFLCTPPPAVLRRIKDGHGVPSNSDTSGSRTSFRNRTMSSTSRPTGPTTPKSSRHVSGSFYRPDVFSLKKESTNASIHSGLYGSAFTQEDETWRLSQYFTAQRHRKVGKFGSHYRKVHAFSSRDAPYFLGYSQDTLIAEMLIHNVVAKTIGLTLLPWNEGPPKRVLDIGCGSGAWVWDMAKKWRETEFIGLDLVPIQTPMDALDDSDDKSLTNRVSWMVANALDGLPFAHGTFDYVHIRYINTGIPESKWTFLLGEAMRILVPGGQIEILESDHSFLGVPLKMQTKDLHALLDGNPLGSPNIINVQPSPSRIDRVRERHDRYSDLAQVSRRILTRLQIHPSPTSFLPSCLTMLEEYGEIGHGKTRHIPMLQRSSIARSVKKNMQKSAKQNGKEAALKPEGLRSKDAFTTGPTSSTPLPPHDFRVSDMDALRLTILVADILRVSDCKYMFWEEIELLRSADRERERALKEAAGRLAVGNHTQVAPMPALLASAASAGPTPMLTPKTPSPATETKPAVSVPKFAPTLLSLKRWSDFGVFDRDLDQWANELRRQTDVELLLKNMHLWEEAATRIDDWTQEEENRKQQRRRHRAFLQDSTSSTPELERHILQSPTSSRTDSDSDSSDENSLSTHMEEEEERVKIPTVAPAFETILGFRSTSAFCVRRNSVES